MRAVPSHCPFCEESTVDYLLDHGNIHSFSCTSENCRPVEMTEWALREYLRSSPAKRAEIVALAQHAKENGMILLLSMPPLAELTDGGERFRRSMRAWQY